MHVGQKEGKMTILYYLVYIFWILDSDMKLYTKTQLSNDADPFFHWGNFHVVFVCYFWLNFTCHVSTERNSGVARGDLASPL